VEGFLALILLLSTVDVFPQTSAGDPSCVEEPARPTHSDAVVLREILGDVDEDGSRDLITGYIRPSTGEAFLHVRFDDGRSTAVRLDDLDPLFTEPEPESVLGIAGWPIIAVRAGPNLVGASYVFITLRGCTLIPLTLPSGGLPEVWIGLGAGHSEWFSCRDDGVVQVETYETTPDPDPVEGATITLYPLEDDGLATPVILVDDEAIATDDVMSTYPPCPLRGTFVDDDATVYENAIEWLAARGFLRGCNPPRNDRVCPHEPVTRGQMAALLSRSLGLPPTGANHFSDDEGSVFAGDIDRLAAAGITRGCNPPASDRYCPESLVDRGQMAAFVARAFDLAANGTDRFVDDDANIFETDIDRIAAAGLTLGCNPPVNDRYCPDEPITRAQFATMLHRASR